MAKRKRSTKIYPGFSPKLVIFLELVLFFFLLGVIVFLLLLLFYSKDLPRPEKFSERQISQPTKIYDRTGEVLLYTIFGEEKREVIPLEEMPEHLKKAVITAEDKNFYSHFGIDPKSIIRALLKNIKVLRPAQGASTIPQQLIRSTFLTPKKTIERKVREVILSIELDRRYSKDQILEWYLNQVPFGSNAYGVEAASKTFFSKKAKDLTLAESAILASLIQAPTYFSPYGEHKDELLAKKNHLLDEMAKQGYISEQQAEQAKQEKIVFSKSSIPLFAPHFVLYVRNYLINTYGDEYLKTKGLRVITSLDYDLQKKAEEIVKTMAEANEVFRAYNASLVAIDPKTGEILAMVGNKDYFADPYPQDCLPGINCLFEPEFNVAVLGKRQPGSAFKPIVYAVAFENGYDDQYIVVDEPTNFGVWGGKEYIPQNYDGLFRGPVTLRQALAQSLNVPSVKVLVNLAGIKQSVEMARKLGISTLKDYTYYGPSLVLGGGEVTLLELTSAYSVFANQGLKNSPTAILKIEDSEGTIVEKHRVMSKRVLSSESTDLLTDVLSDNQARTPMFGPNSSLYIDDQTAAKTGTTQNYNDAWTIGYNNQIVVGVWVGNNDNSPMAKQPGVVLAAPIWKTFMLQVKR
jgi:1A family penicillin-binding protein